MPLDSRHLRNVKEAITTRFSMQLHIQCQLCDASAILGIGVRKHLCINHNDWTTIAVVESKASINRVETDGGQNSNGEIGAVEHPHCRDKDIEMMWEKEEFKMLASDPLVGRDEHDAVANKSKHSVH